MQTQSRVKPFTKSIVQEKNYVKTCGATPSPIQKMKTMPILCGSTRSEWRYQYSIRFTNGRSMSLAVLPQRRPVAITRWINGVLSSLARQCVLSQWNCKYSSNQSGIRKGVSLGSLRHPKSGMRALLCSGFRRRVSTNVIQMLACSNFQITYSILAIRSIISGKCTRCRSRQPGTPATTICSALVTVETFSRAPLNTRRSILCLRYQLLSRIAEKVASIWLRSFLFCCAASFAIISCAVYMARREKKGMPLFTPLVRDLNVEVEVEVEVKKYDTSIYPVSWCLNFYL